MKVRQLGSVSRYLARGMSRKDARADRSRQTARLNKPGTLSTSGTYNLIVPDAIPSQGYLSRPNRHLLVCLVKLTISLSQLHRMTSVLGGHAQLNLGSPPLICFTAPTWSSSQQAKVLHRGPFT